MSVNLWLRGRKLLLGLRSALGRRCLLNGVGPDPAHVAMLRDLRPSFVVDVGANRGQYTLAVLIALQETRVLAFEPLAKPRRLIEELLVPSGRVDVRPVALGAMPGWASINITRDDDSSSLLEPSQLQVATFPGSSPVSRREIEVSTLDLQVRNVGSCALLKIDVQGLELEVLRGGTGALPEFRWIQVEVSFEALYDDQCSPSEIVGHLAEIGFSLRGIVDVLRVKGRVLQADLLFERIE